MAMSESRQVGIVSDHFQEHCSPSDVRGLRRQRVARVLATLVEGPGSADRTTGPLRDADGCRASYESLGTP